jgi:glycerophosphoryl diester phosphodiesterase
VASFGPLVTVFAEPPVLYGHRRSGRGVVDGEFENTLSSFTAAAGHGIPWLEVDVRRTGDDVLVPRHVVAHVESFGIADVVAEPAVGRDAAEAVQVAHEAGLQVAAWCPGPAALIEIGL